MSFNLATFDFALAQAVGIYDKIMGHQGLFGRPVFVRKVVATFLRQGVRALEAYLRRILILMALELEHELVVVDRPENLKRAKEVKVPRERKFSLRVYKYPDKPDKSDGGEAFFAKQHSKLYMQVAPTACTHEATRAPVLVPIDRWLERLDHLHAIAKDPVATARRLAYNLARNRHGILMAPPEPRRGIYRWGREASAVHDAMAYEIIVKSKIRPPPQRRRRYGLKPTITWLDW